MKKVNARLRNSLLLAAAVTAPVALAAALMPLRGHISVTNVALLMVVAWHRWLSAAGWLASWLLSVPPWPLTSSGRPRSSR
jgi:hypothetical protein